MADEDNVIRVQFGEPTSIPEAAPALAGNEEKLAVFTELVEQGTVLVTLDARRDGVVVPERFAQEPRLNLNFCHLFGIADFAYDAEGVRASLSFNGLDHRCEVPWSSVYMMSSEVKNEATLFPASIPPEVLRLIASATLGEEE